ncbi:MAG: sugar ABC transporter ATP-binding protein [Bacillota bacterium]
MPVASKVSSAPVVELRGISKRYDAIEALADLNLTIQKGCIHGLVGENGAGKSTLGKIISGVIPQDEGDLLVNGRQVIYHSPADALRDSIAVISQEVSLVPKRSVIDNVFLGIENRRYGLIDEDKMRLDFDALVERLGFDLEPGVEVSSLGFAEQKVVEIMRAIARNTQILVMDEPTTSLSAEKTGRLLQIVRYLKDTGTTIIYISHFLQEVLNLADSVTILRNGRLIRTALAKEETVNSLVEGMIGISVTELFPPRAKSPGESAEVLSVEGLSQERRLHDVSFRIRAGEIVGLAGLVGSGRSELAKTIFGAYPKDKGQIRICGEPMDIRSPRDAMRAGIAFLPESRKLEGLVMRKDVRYNVSLPHLDAVSLGPFVKSEEEDSLVRNLLRDLDVRPPNPDALVTSLSGGNQQKVLFAKWLFQPPRLFIADEPTTGVDVGAKRAIYRLLISLAERGMAVLLISSELDEVLKLSHRVLCMRLGRIVAEFDASCVREEDVMHAIFATEQKRRH